MILCCLGVLGGALADAGAQGVPQADDAEVPAGQHLDPRVAPVASAPPPVPLVLTLPPPPEPKRPGRSELVRGGLLVGLAALPLTAGIAAAAFASPLSLNNCSVTRADYRSGCDFGNVIAGIWNFFTYGIPTAFILGGTGMVAGGSVLLSVGVRKKRQAVPLISVTPQGSAQRPAGAVLTLSGRF